MATQDLSHSLRTRLLKDLRELEDSPYPGVAVFIDDADIRKLCLVLTPPSGPWKDLSLHFDVVLPPDWPKNPPSVRTSVVGIDHPNFFGDYICCDLLKSQSGLEAGYTGGPALTLRGLFLQFLTFFSSTSVEQDCGEPIHIGDYTVSRYIHEDLLASTLIEGGRGVHISDQLKMEQQWVASTSQETFLATYNLHGRAVTHYAKHMPIGPRLHRLCSVNPRWFTTYESISKWQCSKCPYGSQAFPVHQQAQNNRENTSDSKDHGAPSPQCLLDVLNDDILVELTTHMPSESVVDFAAAYPRFHHLITATRELLQRELRCFFLRTSIRESTVGIGVALQPKSRTLSSDFDWLSKEAFIHFRVRKSIQKREFQYFLPLAFSPSHFERAQGDIWLHLKTLDDAVRTAEATTAARRTVQGGGAISRPLIAPRQAHEVVGVVYRMMNNIVVSLMKSCDDAFNSRKRQTQTLLHASERAVVSYCQLFHLSLSLIRVTPAILHDATRRLRRFIMAPTSRCKSEFPDLGELIVLINLVLACPPVDHATPMSWQLLNGPFLEEAITRNVRWVLSDNPELEVLENGASDYRLYKTFQASRTSLRLIMFQITFLDVFVKTYAGSKVKHLDENYGFPEPEIPERMVKEINAIYRVATWPGFFQRVQYVGGMSFGNEKMTRLLRDAVQKSAAKGYHRPNAERERVIQSRRSLEIDWIKTRRN
ncbi:hypothetical protein H0H93_003465 [Arthromyces matolae]|nr:hypothetical protein H0H93_003465 [Arthromyces matolae]